VAASAVRRLTGDPVVSHESAALLWGIDTLGRHGATLHLSRARRGQGVSRYADLVVHHAAVPPGHRSCRRGAVLTTPARTVVDLARARPVRAGVVAADSALRGGLCTVAELLAVAGECGGWPRVRRAREVVGFADARAASPLVSISRVAFREAGVAAPELGAWITADDWVDLLWPEERVVGELAPPLGRGDPAALRQTLRRRRRLADLGYEQVRWTWQEAYQRPDAVAARVTRALECRRAQLRMARARPHLPRLTKGPA